MIKIAICDDEIAERENILKLCREYYGKNLIVHCFNNGESLLESIKEKDYKVIFLEIEMDKKNGIEVKDILERDGNKSYIIFVTGHKEFMQTAYGRNVMGYLEKPINEERLYYRLDKIESYGFMHQEIEIEDILNQIEIIMANKIKFIHAEHMHTRVVFENGSEKWIRKSLNEWETILNDVAFFRVQKSYIINLTYVKK